MSEKTARGHNHAEAFCLMRYVCDCGHNEIVWNSRDGVTPFILHCPECDGEFKHVSWSGDQYKPDHTPEKGQLVFVDRPPSLCCVLARIRVDFFHGTPFALEDETREAMIQNLVNDMRDGEPFLIRWRW